MYTLTCLNERFAWFTAAFLTRVSRESASVSRLQAQLRVPTLMQPLEVRKEEDTRQFTYL